MIKVWTDASTRPNPGKGGIGIVFEGTLDYDISEKIDGNKLSNNQTEYMAVNRALSEILSYGFNKEEIQLYSDSELLVLQLNGDKAVDKGGKYVGAYLKAKELVKHFPNLTIQYIPREENAQANMLASQALKR